MKTSDTTKELVAALVKVQGKIKHAAKSAENPHFRSRYADLQGIVDACRTELTANGIAYTHACDSADGLVVTVTCRLMHISGEWLESSLTLKPTKPDAQGIGSAITYARRYTLAAAVGVATEDDDGNGATEPTPQTIRAQREVPARTAPATTAGPSNGSGPTKAQLAAEVKAWSGVQPEDLPSVFRVLKKACGMDVAAEAKTSDYPRLLAKVRECVEANITLQDLS